MKAINIPPHPVISNVKLQGNKKAYLIKPDNTIEEINSKKDYKLKELQDIVGGFIEVIYNLPDEKLMIINEEGKIKNKDFNFHATNLALYNRSIASDDFIVGNAIVLNNKQFS